MSETGLSTKVKQILIVGGIQGSEANDGAIQPVDPSNVERDSRLSRERITDNPEIATREKFTILKSFSRILTL